MSSNERENFCRNSLVIVDEAKEVFIGLLNHHLSREKISLEEFVEINRHELYHLFYNAICCLCPEKTHRNYRTVLYHSEFEFFFDTNGPKGIGHVASSRAKHCCSPTKSSIDTKDFDLTLVRCLLVNLTPLIPEGSEARRALENEISIRNHSFGHAKRGSISDEDFERNFSDLERSLLILSRIYGKETEVKKALRKAKTRPLEETNFQEMTETLQKAIEDGYHNLQRTKRQATGQDYCTGAQAKRTRLSNDEVSSVQEHEDESSEEDDHDGNDESFPDRENSSLSQDSGVGMSQLSSDNDKCTAETLQIRVLHFSFSPFVKDASRHILRLELYDGKNKLNAAAFDKAAHKFHNSIKANNCYKISKFRWIPSSIPGRSNEIRLLTFSSVSIINENSVPSYTEKRLSIQEVKSGYKGKETVSLKPVVITAIGTPRKHSEKFCKEVILRDPKDMRKIKLNIWENSEYYTAPFLQQNTLVDVSNVDIMKFNGKGDPEYSFSLTPSSRINEVRKVNTKTELFQEDQREIIPVEIQLSEIFKFRGKTRILIVESATIARFAKYGKLGEITFLNCEVVKNHGQLEKRPNGKWFCNECNAYRRGNVMAQLDAEISDKSGGNVWVKMYDESSKVVLGRHYDDFIDKDYDMLTKCHILKEIEKDRANYRFELGLSCSHDTVIIKKVSRL